MWAVEPLNLQPSRLIGFISQAIGPTQQIQKRFHLGNQLPLAIKLEIGIPVFTFLAHPNGQDPTVVR